MDTINYLSSAIKQFEYYKVLGEKAMAQVEDDRLNWQSDEEANSIATLVYHLHGNMLSRWTDFLTSDGEKPWRERDAEFDNTAIERDALLSKWNEGWNCLFTALNALQADDFVKVVYIRNQGHTVVDAINRQLCHYAYHVGQLVLLCKLCRTADWQSLSIPRGKSADYNADKFSQEKGIRHFTTEYINKNKSE